MSRIAIELFAPVTAFCFGAVVGSFLNVVIHRLPRAECEDGALGDDPGGGGEPEEDGELEPVPLKEALRDLIPGLLSSLAAWRVVGEPRRSFCPGCKQQIAWYDNIPLLSYFALGAKCRSCKAPISIRYFVVELLTALLFAYAAHASVARPMLAGQEPQLGVFAVQLLLVFSIIAVSFIDLDLRIIPDAIDKPGMVLGVALAPLLPALHTANGDLETIAQILGLFGLDVPATLGITGPRLVALASSLLGLSAGALVIYGTGWLGKRLFKKEAMGFGDVKYMAMLGAFLGWKGVLLTLVVGCFAGAAIGLVSKLVTGDSYIPFGPFLSIGALVVLFGRTELLYLLFEWYPAKAQGLMGLGRHGAPGAAEGWTSGGGAPAG